LLVLLILNTSSKTTPTKIKTKNILLEK